MRPSKTPLAAFFGLAICVLAISPVAGIADDWPQWRGVGRDGVWQEKGLIDRFESDQIEIRWRQPIGAGYSGPTVADGRVFVTDRQSRPEQIERPVLPNFTEADATDQLPQFEGEDGRQCKRQGVLIGWQSFQYPGFIERTVERPVLRSPRQRGGGLRASSARRRARRREAR